MKPTFAKYLLILLLLLTSSNQLLAQCPDVINSQQSFCDTESATVNNLTATDTGGGILWFASQVSTTPLASTTPLINGATYFAGDSSNSCQNRQSVIVIIYGTPTGLNFQGVCVEDISEATLTQLTVTGNEIKWYNTPFGGIPLNLNTQLQNNSVYFASQTNPDTGCESSRLAVFVNVRVVTAPSGEAIQSFCYDSSVQTITVADLVVNTPMYNWYLNENSVVPLATNTPLINGHTYYATSVSVPCESTVRFAVTVHLYEENNAGISTDVSYCQVDVTEVDSIVNLFELLAGNPQNTGTWQGNITITNGSLGTIDLLDLQVDTFYNFTYTVSTTAECEESQAVVQIQIIPTLSAGISNQLEICPNGATTYNLFDLLGATADSGGYWIPQLTSGSNIFNSEVDSEGIYTYIFDDNCNKNTSTITISFLPEFNPGENSSLEICENDVATYDLFMLLGNDTDQGGSWSPALSSGTNIFNPQLDQAGIYTYSFNDICSDSATVTITFIPELNPGQDNTLEVCENDTATYNLFLLLGDNADQGGFWTPSLASSTNIFNPQIDQAGTYTYSFANNCSETATITITFLSQLNPGVNNSLVICEYVTANIDLFSILGENADQGGFWTPSLASGTNIFNAQIDPAGNYTYAFNDNCSGSATITVILIPELNPGDSNTIEICQTDTNLIDLFSLLGDDADQGGSWIPSLASGSNIFNPQLDQAGVYTYSFGDICSDTATITVSVLQELNAGEDNTVEICENDLNTVDLFTLLGNDAQQGGFWTPSLASGTNIFNPQLDPAGVYTYSFTDDCSGSATITVSFVALLNPGESNAFEICANELNTIDLFTLLGNNANEGGVWTPTLASGTNIFNPQLDPAGVYTYSFNDLCSDSATVTITHTPSLYAGEDNVIEICPDDTNFYDMFTFLGENTDQGGIWTPPLTSGGGIFNQQLDAVTVYTYSFNDSCSDSATITISLLSRQNAGEDNTLEICENDTNTYNLFDLLGENTQQGGIWTPSLASGTNIFNPQVDTANSYTYSLNGTCSDSATIIISILQSQNAGEDNTLEICENDTNTYNLFDLLGTSAEQGGVWTPELTSGTNIFDPQVDTANTYTYSFLEGCSQLATISIELINCDDPQEDELLIPDGFSPNDDGINDYFEIRNIRTLYPNFKIEIYNRYGNLLFVGDRNTNDWDGTTQKGIKVGDGKAPAGVYFYILNFNDGQKSAKQGRLYLSR